MQPEERKINIQENVVCWTVEWTRAALRFPSFIVWALCKRYVLNVCVIHISRETSKQPKSAFSNSNVSFTVEEYMAFRREVPNSYGFSPRLRWCPGISNLNLLILVFESCFVSSLGTVGSWKCFWTKTRVIRDALSGIWANRRIVSSQLPIHGL